MFLFDDACDQSANQALHFVKNYKQKHTSQSLAWTVTTGVSAFASPCAHVLFASGLFSFLGVSMQSALSL